MRVPSKRSKYCTCTVRCRGGTFVSPSTFYRHRVFPGRDTTELSAEFGQFIASLPGPEAETTQAKDRTEEVQEVDLNDCLAFREDGIVDHPDFQEHHPTDDGDDTLSNEMQEPQQPEPDSSIQPGVQEGPESSSLINEYASSPIGQPQSLPGGDAPVPGSAAADGMDMDEPFHPPEGGEAPDLDDDNLDLDYLIETAQLNDVKVSLEFIRALKTASFEDGMYELDEDIVERLRNPPTTPIHLSPDERLSLDLFLSTQNAAQDVYIANQKAILRRHPDDGILSYDGVKKLAAEISGIFPITDHMCINSCIAYTGPFRTLTTCPYCSETRLDPATKKPRQVLNTIPLGPQLQALKRHRDSAMAAGYRHRRTQAILKELADNDGNLSSWEDLLDGTDYIKAVQSGLIGPDDMVVMLSIDGAQLYMSKQSDCWICIWIIVDFSPQIRYKKKAIMQAFTIPGPKKPKHMDSFLFTSLHHLAILEKEGLRMWDAYKGAIVTSYPFFAMGTADGPAMTHLNGLVGHMGKNGCRLYCGVTGRRKPRDSHYYPALLKPLDYSVDGCDHGDIDFDTIALREPSVEVYEQNLKELIQSRNETAYKSNRLDTGIVKPSIFLGLDRKHRLPVPRCFGSDIMHHGSLNIPDLLIPLWRGTFDCSSGDRVTGWGWAVLTGDTWNEHGKTVAMATPYLPGSFDRPPRDPALKISSGYKAWEFLLYLYGLGPGVFYKILPDAYYTNFCDLVSGMRIVNQHRITADQLVKAHEAFTRFVRDFEMLYYQRRADRIHFIRQSVHQCLHIVAEILRVGPPICSSQWTMERTIGDLTQELRQPSNPYANLSQRSIIRSRVNALKNMIPDLEETANLPRGAIALGDDYTLLRRRDTTCYELRPCEEQALALYIQNTFGVALDIPSPWNVIRWARLRLPNGQTARCKWGEGGKTVQIRMSRNVKIVQGATERVQVAEVQFYFILKLEYLGINCTLALVSYYSPPDQGLLDFSRGTLWSCCHDGDASLAVIDAKSISAVVAMVPHKPFPGERDRYFMVEKPGLDVAGLGEANNDEMQMEVEE